MLHGKSKVQMMITGQITSETEYVGMMYAYNGSYSYDITRNGTTTLTGFITFIGDFGFPDIGTDYTADWFTLYSGSSTGMFYRTIKGFTVNSPGGAQPFPLKVTASTAQVFIRAM
ncbi:MAG: hypothetical protein LBS51_08525 [Oscillospiraceae bacterium]|nr:hypothetical protein [Oscillospiraceae bacterium]